MNKQSKIKHMPSGKWRVTDSTGKKNLGESGSKGEAVKRLKQVEYFKNHKDKKAFNNVVMKKLSSVLKTEGFKPPFKIKITASEIRKCKYCDEKFVPSFEDQEFCEADCEEAYYATGAMDGEFERQNDQDMADKERWREEAEPEEAGSTNSDEIAIPDNISPEGRMAAEVILETIRKANAEFSPNGEIHTGGCKTFYSPEEWKARGEQYGENAILIVVHDGGEVSPFFDEMKEQYRLVKLMYSSLKRAGFWAEPMYNWCTAIYKK